jgi:hypothetical protein
MGGEVIARFAPRWMYEVHAGGSCGIFRCITVSWREDERGLREEILPVLRAKQCDSIVLFR